MIELTTQCPQCQHQFDVTLEQLQLRKGLLRCPRCAHIFDAYECAVTKSVSPLVFSTPEPEAEPESDFFQTHTIGEHTQAASLAASSLIKTRSSGSALRSQQPIQSLTETSEDDIRVYLNREPQLNSETVLADLKGLRAEPRPPSSPRPDATAASSSSGGGLWRVIVGLLCALLVAQLLYVYRAQIANTVSFTRPVLQLLCGLTGCTVPYMREIDAIEIRQTSLQQQPNFEQNGRYAYLLQLQMKNNLPWTQEWPTLVLSFSDASAAALANIALAPQDYLPPSQRSRPFEPGAQLSLRVPVTIPHRKINGFIVEKYFP